MRITLEDLFVPAGLKPPSCNASVEITDITDDSRRAGPGSLFVAVKGFTTDGHLFIEKALKAGASAVLSEREVPGISTDRLTVNPSGDNRSALAEVSAAFYRYPWMDMKTVGITGTNGKTSTAHMLRWILEKNGIQTGIMGTVGHIAGGTEIEASVTTPGSLQVAGYMRKMADAGDKACVMEVSSHALALHRVSSVRFDGTLFTNISQDHLDFHKDMDEYLKTKIKLFSLMKKNGTAVVGTYSPDWPAIPDAVTFGENDDDSYRISDIHVAPDGSSFTVHCSGMDKKVKISAPGRFNVYNATGALATAVEMGIPLSSAAGAVASFPGVPGRMESVSCGQKFLVAVDYAHTPDALERVLSQGKHLAEGRLLAVFGCGGDRDSRKRPIMGEIASRIADVALVTSDNPRTEDPKEIINDILAGIAERENVLVRPDRAEAIALAVEMAQPGDVVIIAGKGHEDYQILGLKKIHFDDREQARAALDRKGFKCVL